MSVALIIIIVAIVVAIAVLIGALIFVADSRKRVQRFAQSADLIPGRSGRAPDDWSTSTAPEAQLHQRIRYAIADVHQAPGANSTPEVIAARNALDDAVFALDDRLIAAAALPGAGSVGVIDTRVVEKEDDEDPEPDRAAQAEEAAQDIDSEKATELRALERTILILEALPKKVWDAAPEAAVADINATAAALVG